MRNLKTLTALMLCLVLLLSPLTVYADPGEEDAADEPAEETQQPEFSYIVIRTEEDFLQFAENCRLDTYSSYLSVTMMTDLDLTDMEMESIPIFAGVFDGGGHSIRGLSIEEDGSVRGLFRYVARGAEIRNLHITGSVLPSGSRSTVGGIAGSNAGTIRDCSFEGEVGGADEVGGIAGINEVGGVIEGCSFSGSVHGSHFVGGITGSNYGVVRSCSNAAMVNTEEQQNQIELSDISLETMTGAETAATATDIGGIAGTSSGVLRNCANTGDVGYLHVGYNVGGIVGSQQGYLTECTNRGEIFGRKDVGGIVGQMVPNALLNYEADTLQILEEQLGELEGIAGQAQANAQSTTSEVTAGIGAMGAEIEKAGQALNELLPQDPDDPIPDEDSLLAAQSVLSSTLTTLTGQMNDLMESTQSAVGALSGSVQELTGQMNVIGETIGHATEGLGGSITDVSDLDTEELLTGKVSSCTNYGEVQGDLNAGGIVGTISVESNMDPENDLEVVGSSSMNFEFEARAVVLRCENQAVVAGKTRDVGGIVGWMSLGLARDCLNGGAVRAESAEYVGGIAGRSSGYIRESDANCAIYGAEYVGGIAGSGTIVSDCRSMVQFHGGRERLGAILGFAEPPQGGNAEQPIIGNYYFAVDDDPGAIDGVSYGGQAEPLKEADFLALEGLPEIFRIVRIRFVFEDGTEQTLIKVPGKGLREHEMPAIPEKSGYAAEWVGPEGADLNRISFDITFEAVYSELRSVLQSEETDAEGKPLLLVQGVFEEGEVVSLCEASNLPAPEEKETVLTAQGFALPQSQQPMTVRLLAPNTPEQIHVLVRDAAGNWRKEAASLDRSYVIFAVQAGDTACCVVEEAPDLTVWYLLGGGIALLAVLITVIALASRKKKRKNV